LGEAFQAAQEAGPAQQSEQTDTGTQDTVPTSPQNVQPSFPIDFTYIILAVAVGVGIGIFIYFYRRSGETVEDEQYYF